MQVGQIIELFIILLSWPNLKGLTRPLSPFFHPLNLWLGGQDKFLKERFSKEEPTPVVSTQLLQ
jgi:hypothetical protein